MAEENNSVDDFFNKKKKKTSKKNKKTMLTAADLLKETEEPREIENLPKDQVNSENQAQEDEWLENDSEQVFVIEGPGIKRLVTDEKTPLGEEQNSSDNEEGGEENREKGETSWKNNVDPNVDPNAPPATPPIGQMPGQMPTRQAEQEQEENKTASEPTKRAYVPPSQRKVEVRMPERSGPYRNRQKINIESNADFPTLGAAADSVQDGFDVVTTKAGGRSWGGGSSVAATASTGISNRFQGLENN